MAADLGDQEAQAPDDMAAAADAGAVEGGDVAAAVPPAQ
jgi:hypothetical protein